MAITCDAATVKAFCGEFSSLSDPAIAPFIAAAQVQASNSDAIGSDRLELMRVYLTGHMLALAYPDLYAGGTVQSETVGQVSRTYAVPTQIGQSELNLTRYGSEYKRLLRGTGLTFLVP